MRPIRTGWQITGKVRSVERPLRSWASRVIYFECDGFPTEDQAKEALLYSWSPGSPPGSYEARVLAIQKFEFAHTLILQDDS